MRLIDADALKTKAYPFPCAIGVENAVTIRAINEAPTIEPTVKRGKWVKQHPEHAMKLAVCSECNYLMLWWNKSIYCPNCGADMRTEGKNE